MFACTFPTNCVKHARAVRAALRVNPTLPPGLFSLENKKNIIDESRPRPRVGSVAVMHNSVVPSDGHVAVVYKIQGDTVYLAEANYGGKMCRTDRKMAYNSKEIYGYFY
ncbi:CHAP domain-containing protein [Hymenobacter weizhouensis]|uniref:CHAP domain-containing protein n=1 Tax=Hymenobacter sp. YIM 151500-1 TaxID=2987689 RepID=UPI002227BB76|nr:CHAP domain-containing protein [Hymenobacter sp. YIM 151500-1]UYZ61570.1 CHAP domain-containing protein [Hymenobacter sp. YIM 151500-1]